jgi:NAD(P)-dependent dehydrogenase (short-subunit alcohol dehydrogenase family)
MTAHRFDLTERVALVTGAGSGIGAGIAEALAAAGARVVLVGRRSDRLEIMRDAIEAGGGRADVLVWDIGGGDTAEGLVDAAVQRAGFVDVLVHAAGVQVRRPALEYEVADWDAVLGIHLRAAFTLSQAVGRHLQATGRPGSLIDVGSLTSQRTGLATTVAYGAAKSGLLGLMRTLAVEWAPYGIRVNTLLVGFVATEMTREIDNRPERLALTSRVPMGRLGTPEDIGGVAAFLASDLAAYVTGEAVTVDGGWSDA